MDETKTPQRNAARACVPRSRLVSVLALDICGYAGLAERDEALAVRAVNTVAHVLSEHVAQCHGRIFHRAGDGFLAEFASAGDCLEAALGVRAAISAHNGLRAAGPLQVRIGLHAGDVVDQGDGDLLGHTVNLAARLQQAGRPGGILASTHFANLVSARFEGRMRRCGALSLKHLDTPVEAFDIDTTTGSWWHWRRRSMRVARHFGPGAAFVGLALYMALGPTGLPPDAAQLPAAAPLARSI